MEQANTKPAIRMLNIIVDHKNAKQVEGILTSYGIQIQHLYSGSGTASSEILDYLGFGISEKAVISCTVPKNCAGNLLRVLNARLDLHRANRGLAYTIPVSGASSLVVKMMGEGETLLKPLIRQEETEVKASGHCLLIVMINQGYSDEVMDAARRAGAMGGTVVHARRLGADEPMKKWGIHVQAEKEMMYLLVDRDTKTPIMNAIQQSCGIQTPVQGVVIALPVDAVVGLNSQADELL